MKLFNPLKNVERKLCSLSKASFKSLLFAGLLCATHYSSALTTADMEVSLNSNGTLIAIGYLDKNGRNQLVDIAELSQKPNLKRKTLELGGIPVFTIAFGIQPDSLLITTIGEENSDLLRVNVSNTKNPKIEKLYTHSAPLRFPKEMVGKKIVFLEQFDTKSGASIWKIFDGVKSSNTISKTFSRAANPSVVGESAFLPVPIKGKGIVDIIGKTPNAIRDFFDAANGFMVCADTPDSISCIKYDPTILLTESYSNLIVNKGGYICKVAGQWRDMRSLDISRDGTRAIFHAIPRGEKERGLYLIDLNGKDCRTQLIHLSKEN